jgi:diguanylate cyclase (GGDEF)-like protein/PAS domain S-box-containing protein
MWVYDVETLGFLAVNAAAVRRYGWTRDEFLTMTIADIRPREDVERLLANVAEETDAYQESGDWRHRKKGGETIDVEVTSHSLLFEGRPARLVLAHDVTAERVAQAALRESEARLRMSEQRSRALVEHATDIITVLTADGRVRYSSPAATRVLGYPDGFWRGRDVFELVHPDDVPHVAEEFLRSLETPGIGEPIEFRMHHADGSWRYMEATGNNLLEDPAVRGVVVTTRDVTERREADDALRASEARFRSLVQKSYDVIAVCDAPGTVRYVSPSIEAVLGVKPDEVVGRNAFEWIHPDDGAEVAASLARLLDGTSPQRAVEFRARHQDGSWRHVELAPTNLLDDPAVGGIVCNVRDITERRRAEEELSLLQTIVAAVHEAADLDSALGITVQRVCETSGWVCGVAWVPRTDGSVLEMRRSWHRGEPALQTFCETSRDLRLPPGAGLPGRAWFTGEPVLVSDVRADEKPGRGADAAAAGLRAGLAVPVLAEREVVAVLELFDVEARDDGERRRGLVSAIAGQLGTVIERKRAQERLAHQALHDPLTELPNRALFLDRLALGLARLRRRHSSLAVLFADLDRFKLVNDSLGHDAGDQLLVAVAGRLREVLRPGDTLARFGGDEFAVLCEDVAQNDVVPIADRILECLAGPLHLANGEVFVTMSLGIALATSPDEQPEALLRDADAAMYLAKDRGRARHELFDEAMRDRSMERLALESALRRAIDRDELVAFYQPIVALADGAITSAEALVRWQHPERGLLEPAEFVPLAEESGLIVAIDRWVLERACHQAGRWQHDGSAVTVGLNLSARQLTRPGLIDTVRQALDDGGADPHHLWVEITESVLMEDADLAGTVLGRLRALGVRVCVDDFGTGYSSLSYLTRFPVDALKIDRSFVSGLTSNAGDAAVVEAVVGMAHSLGLAVVAEGVETADQVARLRDLGCDAAQGYWFARPGPADDVSELLRAGHRWP